MTNCITLSEKLNRDKKPIKLVKHLEILNNIQFSDTTYDPKFWDNIILLCKQYNNTSFDLMFAYDDKTNEGVLYLEQWNDGIVG